MVFAIEPLFCNSSTCRCGSIVRRFGIDRLAHFFYYITGNHMRKQFAPFCRTYHKITILLK